MDTENGSRIKYGWLPFHTHLLYQMSLQVISCSAIQTSIRNEFRVSKFYPLNPLKVHKTAHERWGPGFFEARQQQVVSPHVERLLFIWKIPYNVWFMMVFEFSAENVACVEVCKLTLGPYRRFEVLQELEPIYKTNVYYMFEVILINYPPVQWEIQLKIKGRKNWDFGLSLLF